MIESFFHQIEIHLLGVKNIDGIYNSYISWGPENVPIIYRVKNVTNGNYYWITTTYKISSGHNNKNEQNSHNKESISQSEKTNMWPSWTLWAKGWCFLYFSIYHSIRLVWYNAKLYALDHFCHGNSCLSSQKFRNCAVCKKKVHQL